MKQNAMVKIMDLRQQAKSVDERARRRRDLLRRILTKVDQYPLYKAFKKWNWQRFHLKSKLINHREEVRMKYFEKARESQGNITQVMHKIIGLKREEKLAYDKQYDYEMNEIKK